MVSLFYEGHEIRFMIEGGKIRWRLGDILEVANYDESLPFPSGYSFDAYLELYKVFGMFTSDIKLCKWISEEAIPEIWREEEHGLHAEDCRDVCKLLAPCIISDSTGNVLRAIQIISERSNFQVLENEKKKRKIYPHTSEFCCCCCNDERDDRIRSRTIMNEEFDVKKKRIEEALDDARKNFE